MKPVATARLQAEKQRLRAELAALDAEILRLSGVRRHQPGR
jgi:hypothetical protein